MLATIERAEAGEGSFSRRCKTLAQPGIPGALGSALRCDRQAAGGMQSRTDGPPITGVIRQTVPDGHASPFTQST